ncbi:MAG: NAD(P)/FAD-dependent oxidoreductase [Saprospiraceae bacterium]|nr:NAD(P)/FAD-dependent oxidoreductase [Lewinella sp.]
MNTTIVIGAGPAGLTAAYELQKLGSKSVILEADHQVGGISKTVNFKGNRFDIGGHRFFSKVPYINQVWDEILEEDFLVCERLSRILYKEHFFDYPLKPLNALAGLGVQESIHVIFSYVAVKFSSQRKRRDTNFEEWVISRFGYKLYEIFFKTYTEKVWGIPCSSISSDWASQRIKNFSLKEAIINAFSNTGKNKNGEVITTIIEQFKYPRLGPGMMWEHCQRALAKQNNPTLMGERVTTINHRNNKVLDVVCRNEAGEETTYSGEHFISSMPLREMILALRPLPPNNVVEAARKLHYRDYLTVVLTVNREEVFPDNWIYIHTPKVKLGRIQNYKNWSREMVSNPKNTTLGLEYFLWEKDEEWEWADDRLIEMGIRECTEIGLIRPDEVVEGTVVRVKKAYPVYDLNYTTYLKTIESYLEGFENLQTVGRNGLHRYNNQDHSMLTGIYAARNILGANHHIWSVNTEKDYHEEGKLEQTPSGGRLVPIPKFN